MAGKFFGIPFASTGDKTAVPDSVQPDGSVSYSEGFGFDYERADTDPAYKPVPREQTNQLYFDLTEAVGIIQKQGYADWTSAAAPYAVAATVRHNNAVWRNKTASNSDEPGVGAGATSWENITSVTVPDASETVKGIVELATNAEVVAGTDTVRAVTPAGLKVELDKKAPIGSPAFTGTPTAPTPATGLRSTAIATMQKFADEFSASLAASSCWQKLPSGLIIQWGVVNISPDSTAPVTFPIVFPSACAGVNISHQFAPSLGIEIGTAAYSVTTSGFTALNSASTAGANPHFWMAIGY